MAHRAIRAALAVVFCFLVPAAVFAIPAPVPPAVQAHSLVGGAPQIDGEFDPGEWPGDPQITIGPGYTATNYAWLQPVVPTYTTFASDAEYLYILVDVVGDTTDAIHDECLFVFAGSPVRPAVIIVHDGSLDTDSLGGQRAAGFGPSPNSSTPHRIYEFSIPHSALGTQPGGSVAFCSPFWKDIAGSMGYDSSTGHDNVWPPALVWQGPNDPDTSSWATLALAGALPADVPATNGWGLAFLLMALAVTGAAAILRQA